MKTKILIRLVIASFLTVTLLVSSVYFFATKTNVYASGEVSILDSLVDSSHGIEYLFLTLFDEDSPMPMPYAAIKIRLAKERKKGIFYKFILTADNMQLMQPQENRLPKFFRIKARLDISGQGGTDKPGDLIGEQLHVPYGSENIHIEISQKIASYSSQSSF
jgi:hypothetical protein